MTARGKAFARQLKADGRVQILGYTKYKETIRLSGRAVEVPEDEQVKWRDVLYAEQPYLENVYPGETKNIDTMFMLKSYTIEYFCLSTRPIVREYFAVGNAEIKKKGYCKRWLYRLRHLPERMSAELHRRRNAFRHSGESLPAMRELL